MDSKENARSIITDENLDKFGKINTRRTKNGYKVKYKKKGNFLPTDKTYSDDDYVGFFIFSLILTGGITLICVAAFAAMWTWFIVPTLLLILWVYMMIEGKHNCFQDAIIVFINFIVTVGLTWVVLSAAYNDKFFNDSEGGRKRYHYVKEHVNPELLYFKK